MYLLLCCLYLSSIYYRSEAVSLTRDDTTDVCPGTELTCTCSVPSPILVWNLPGSVTIVFGVSDSVGSNRTGTNGVFFAVVTVNTGGKESMLKYNATESLMSSNIECEDPVSGNANTTTITVTFAG